MIVQHMRGGSHDVRRAACRRGDRQTETLYQAEGQHNPHLARAQRKKLKKRAKPSPEDDAFDFDVLEDDAEEQEDVQ